ncbi:MAG: hypothetical protein A2161_01690 [Candidatus Schekmanbacteria bacterium RBG_13_48_7]|uniref:Uncharacterized protein n=1 Tax=Candidatus Schekmanbacteria bacterium RBG_13_48_7 TaxID=1817878 RepID=A0A1F7RM21_9BACT|nr:MAG: hypothetical protein A2161_01690 [Candidatus Schekmanbacteria bacterium RBG_13_48_7]
MLRFLTQYYNVSVDYLLGLETDPMTQEAFNPDAIKIKSMLQDMDDKSKDFLNNIFSMYLSTIRERDKERDQLIFKNPVDLYNFWIRTSLEIEEPDEDVIELRTEFFKSKGNIFKKQCNLKKAVECYEQAYNYCRTLRDSIPDQEKLMNQIGKLYGRMGHYKRSLICFEKALDLSQDDVRRGTNYMNIGITSNFLGNSERAIFCLEKACDLLKSSNSSTYFQTYSSLGILYYKTGNYQKSLQYFLDAVSWAESRDDLYRQSLNLNWVGVIYEKIGCFDLAEKIQYNGLTLAQKIGDKLRIGIHYLNLGILKKIRTDYKKSAELILESLRLFEEADDIDGQAEANTELARINQFIGDNTTALKYLQTAQKLAADVNDPELDADLLFAYSEYFQKMKRTDDAINKIDEAIKLTEKHLLPDYKYYFFRTKLYYKMKLWEKASKDIYKCIEKVEKIMKNVPDEYLEAFKNRSDVKEVYRLINKFMER